MLLLLLLPLLSNRNVSVSFTFASKMHSSDGIWAIIPNIQRWLSAIFFQRFGRQKKKDTLRPFEWVCWLWQSLLGVPMPAAGGCHGRYIFGEGKLYGQLLVKRLCSFKFYCGRHLRLFLLVPSASYSSLWRYHFLLFSVFGGGHFVLWPVGKQKPTHFKERERQRQANMEL